MRIIFFFLVIITFGCNKPDHHVIGEKFVDPIIDKLAKNDVQLEVPQRGEWRFVYKEKRQTFDSYKLSKPVEPDSIRRKLYLLPIGEFTPMQDSIVKFTGDYLQRFFQLETTILPFISENIVPKSARRFNGGTEQLLSAAILNYLQSHIPDDGIVIMAITTKDLYPADDWNFVFGQARTKARVAVSSLYRYSDQPLNESNYNICLERIIKTSAHEVGHMFGCQHCTYRVCLMNGSLNLNEADSRPNRLCSECLKKVQWNLRLDIQERLNALNNFFDMHNLERDYELTMQDLVIVADVNRKNL